MDPTTASSLASNHDGSIHRGWELQNYDYSLACALIKLMVRHAAAHRHVHKKKRKQPFDYVVYFFTVATPLFELPQLHAIYTSRDAGSLSVVTWVFFLLSSIVFAIYTLRERIMPLFVAYSLYTVIESAIVIGVIIYS